MAGMAASVGLFRRNIDGAGRDTVKFDRTTEETGRSIDKLSGRLGLLVDVAATLGPALIPTAAAAVPLIAGLTNQLGFAAIAGGTTILAFHGVGDALKAVNEQAINPSTANLEKMHEAMAKLGPAGRDFVRELQSLRPELQKLESAAQAGLFPGMTEGIQSLTTRLPQAQELISTVADTLGTLMAKAGDSLAGPEWDAFFHMLQSEARPTLMALGESIGQVTKGLADLWVAFTPLNRSFSTGMLEASRSFAQWADGLSQTQGFADFMAYLQSTGPKVAEALGAIGNAVLQVLEAAAPLGGPALAAITAFSKAVAAIADSSLGTPILAAVAAWRAYSMVIGLAEKAQMRFNATSSSGGAVGRSVSGYQAQVKAIGSLPAAFKAATVAQEELVAAQREARLVTAQYNGQLQAVNKITAFGGKPSMQTLGSLNDSLSKVEMANHAVTESTRKAAEAEAGRSRAMRQSAIGIGKTAAGVAALGVASTGAADKIGLTNTVSLALAGTLFGPWGSAIGAGAGAVIDLTKANDGLNDSLTKLGAMAGQVDFATFNDKIAKTQKQIDDLKHVTGVGDWFSDTGKVIGGALLGHTVNSQIADKQGKLDAAEAKNDNEMRTRGAIVANQQMAASSQLAADGFKTTAAGAREASMSVQQFTFSMAGATAALARASNWDSFRGAVLDAKDAVDKAGKTLAHNGDIIKGQGRDMQRAGLESRGLLHNIAQQAITTSEGMRNVANRTKFLDGARDKFIAVARAMGASGPAARRMADTLGLVDRGSRKSAAAVQDLNAKIRGLKSKIVDAKAKGAKESSAEVQALRAQIAALRAKQVAIKEAGAEAARQRVHDLQAAIAQLNGKTVTITTVHNDRYHKLVADGGTIYATGGTVHGARLPYADKVPAILAPGEEVISNRFGQADRHRDLLKRINANMLADGGTVLHFADGGTADRRRNNNGGGNNDHPHRHHGNDNHKHVNRFVVALKEATKSLDKEKAARDALISKRNDLSGTVRDKFLTDPFAGGNVWAAGGGNPLGILKADISKANAFKSVLFALKKSGLHGDALASIASTGDMGQAQALLSMGKGGVGQYEKLFDQRAKAAGAVGNYAGNAAYGAAIATTAHQVTLLNAHVVRLEHTIRRQHKEAQKNHKHNADHTGKAVAKGVNKGASAGTRGSRGHR